MRHRAAVGEGAPEARHPRLRRHGSAPRPEMDGRRQAAEHAEARRARRASTGSRRRTSPESPTAWASFATGVNAGKHNIYDFLVRDTRTYLPDLGMVHREPPRFILNYIPIAAPKLTSIRGGTSFWVTAGRAGVRSSVLTVPVTFPPEDVPNGELLSGLPLPDIRGTMGTVLLLRHRPEPLRRRQHGVRRHPEAAGVRRRHRADRARRAAESDRPPAAARSARRGADRRGQNDGERQKLARRRGGHIRLPITIHWNKAGRSATIDIGDSTGPPAGRRMEQVDQPRLQRQPARAHPRHGAALSDSRRSRSCSSTSRPSTGSRTTRPRRCRRRRRSPPTSTSGSGPTARSAGPKPRGRSTRTASTRRRSWTISIARSTIARRSSSSGIDRTAVGSARRRHRVDRPRAAHDVAAHRSDAPDVRQGAGGEVRRLDRARLPQVRRLRRRGDIARRRRHADPDRLGPRLPLVPPVGQPEHLARAGGVHDAPRPPARREEARRSVRRRRPVLGERRLDAHQGVRDGPRPDLSQPERPRRKGHRRPGGRCASGREVSSPRA